LNFFSNLDLADRIAALYGDEDPLFPLVSPRDFIQNEILVRIWKPIYIFAFN